MATEAHVRASRKYDSSHTVGFYMKLNITTDADVLEWLRGQDNKQGKIKELIRKDIEKNEA